MRQSSQLSAPDLRRCARGRTDLLLRSDQRADLDETANLFQVAATLGVGMSRSASLISAVAAALAALLAGLNLYYTGRRERQRWVRETLVELLIAYLDVSFAAEAEAKRYRNENGASRQVDARGAIDEVLKEQDQALTKLRLITGRVMVDAALNLHDAAHEFVDVATATPERPDDELRRASDGLWQARHRFVAAGKRAVGLPRGRSRAVGGR